MFSLEKVESNPRSIFIFDGIGAVISAFMLGVILTTLEELFGIPSSALLVLACIPLFFLLYDIYVYFRGSNTSLYIRGIAILNLIYCVLSIGYGIIHRERITALGWIYICGEIIIIVGIAVFELRLASRVSISRRKE